MNIRYKTDILPVRGIPNYENDFCSRKVMSDVMGDNNSWCCTFFVARQPGPAIVVPSSGRTPIS